MISFVSSAYLESIGASLAIDKTKQHNFNFFNPSYRKNIIHRTKQWQSKLFSALSCVLIIRPDSRMNPSLFRKKIQVVGGGFPLSLLDLQRQLRTLDVTRLLLMLGALTRVADQQKVEDGRSWIFGTGALYDLVYLAAAHFDRESIQIPSESIIFDLGEILFNTTRADNSRPEWAEEHLQKLHLQQFEAQREKRNLFARTILLYTQAWSESHLAKQEIPNIRTEITRLTGMPLSRYLVVGIILSAYNLTSSTAFQNESLDICRSRVSFERDIYKFIQTTHCSYTDLSQSVAMSGPDNTYSISDPFLLRKFPLILVPDSPPAVADSYFIIPFPELVLEKVTRGLFYDLADHFRKERANNRFRSGFGHAFQKYVSIVTKNTLQNTLVLDEDDFLHKELGTDLVVLEGERGVAIEIKHASIRRPSKTTGTKEALEADLKSTVGKAMTQLFNFKNRSHVDMRILSVRKWEYLVVTYDSLSWANAFNKLHALATVPSTMKQFARDVHIISIDDLEYFLAHAKTAGLAKSLEEKRQNDEDSQVDFNEYMDKLALGNLHNSYLDEIRNQFFKYGSASVKFE